MVTSSFVHVIIILDSYKNQQNWENNNTIMFYEVKFMIQTEQIFLHLRVIFLPPRIFTKQPTHSTRITSYESLVRRKGGKCQTLKD